jgi:hypothetical protein
VFFSKSSFWGLKYWRFELGGIWSFRGTITYDGGISNPSRNHGWGYYRLLTKRSKDLYWCLVHLAMEIVIRHPLYSTHITIFPGKHPPHPLCPSVCPSSVCHTKILIHPVITFFWFFCNKLACYKCKKVTKPDFRRKIWNFFYKQFFEKWGFSNFLENAVLVLAEISYLDI